jgi:hypothetical protein
MTTFTNPHERIEQLMTRIDELDTALRDAENIMTLVEPRSHKREYLACLKKARRALGMNLFERYQATSKAEGT